MSELERLKADLEVLQRHQSYSIMENAIADVADKIARLEAEADPWREAKEAIGRWRGSRLLSGKQENIVAYVDHLTAEVDRLTKRVAELESVQAKPYRPHDRITMQRRIRMQRRELRRLNKSIDAGIWHTKYLVQKLESAEKWVAKLEVENAAWKEAASVWTVESEMIDTPERLSDRIAELCGVKTLADMQPPFEGPIVGLEPVLDPARVLATAAEFLRVNHRCSPVVETFIDVMGANDVKPYPLKGAKND